MRAWASSCRNIDAKKTTVAAKPIARLSGRSLARELTLAAVIADNKISAGNQR